MWTNYGALLHSSMLTTDNIIQYHGGLQTRKFGQTQTWVTNVSTSADLNIEFSAGSTKNGSPVL